MKKIVSAILLMVTLISSAIVYASPGEIDVKFNNSIYGLTLLIYTDGIEELYEEKSNLNPYVIPEDAEIEKAIEQKIQEKYEQDPDGVRLDFQDGSFSTPNIYPELVLFPNMSNKYPADEYFKNMDWSGEPVILAGLKYFDTGTQNNVKSIIIENGIISTEIASLNDFPQLTSVIIPESVTQIMIQGSSKYYEEKILNKNWSEYFGIPANELYTVPYLLDDGEIIYDAAPEYQKIINELNNEHAKAEKKICARESNNKVTFYTKSGSYAESYLHEIGLNVQNYVSVKYEDKEIFSDQPAVIVDGRTLVPLRAIFETMDADVEWNNDTRTVVAKRNKTQISLQIDSDQLFVDGIAKRIDVPAKLINGRTMVPARAVAEAFGCNVGWNDETSTVIITNS